MWLHDDMWRCWRCITSQSDRKNSKKMAFVVATPLIPLIWFIFTQLLLLELWRNGSVRDRPKPEHKQRRKNRERESERERATLILTCATQNKYRKSYPKLWDNVNRDWIRSNSYQRLHTTTRWLVACLLCECVAYLSLWHTEIMCERMSMKMVACG